jgi:hypothetical protein
MTSIIKHVEKDFFLKALYDEQIPIVYVKDQIEYILTLDKPAKADMHFRANCIIPKLQAKEKMNLTFTFWYQVVSFSANIISFRDIRIQAATPEFLYTERDALPVADASSS